MFEIKKHSKEIKEVYVLYFDGGHQEFILDEHWRLISVGQYGTYECSWSPETERTFKEFLSQIPTSYFLNMIASHTHFDRMKYKKKLRQAIKEEFSSYPNFKQILQDVEDQILCEESFEAVSLKVFEFHHFKDFEPYYFLPNLDYSPQVIGFVDNLFTAFQALLKEELSKEALL